MILDGIIEYLNLKLHLYNEKTNIICDLYNASIKEYKKNPD